MADFKFNPTKFRKTTSGDYNIFFDEKYDFHAYLNHKKRKTDQFPHHGSMTDFLDENTEIKIYLTYNENVKPFEKIEGWFIVNMTAYLEFCEAIKSKWKWRTRAFLSQNISIKNASFTDEERDIFIAQNTTEKNISEIIKILPTKTQMAILWELQDTTWSTGKFNFTQNADGIFLWLWDVNNKELVVTQLKQLEQNKFANIENALSISKIDKVLDIWGKNKSNPHEVSFWQDFLKTNSWILAQVFPAPFAIFENEFYVWWHYSWSLSGSKKADFGYKNIFSWNTAIIEIKTPITPLVSKNLYWTRKGIYPMSEDLIWAISQVLNQKDLLQKDYLQNNAAKDFKVWNPKIILIIWSEEYEQINLEQRACFELFKNSNKDIEIITFDELFEKIKNLKSLYE